jgi:Smg protein
MAGMMMARDIGPGALRYSQVMFDVLVYLYEHYWRPDAFPESGLLARKLTAVGFESDEISEALTWLDGLHEVTREVKSLEMHSTSFRVYSGNELEQLGEEALGFLSFLESAGVLTPSCREMVLDRVSASPESPVSLDDLKIIVLMVFWSAGHEPDALILDELFTEADDRVFH